MKYRSKLEKMLAEGPFQKFEYEPKDGEVSYCTPHNYTPDFVDPDDPDVLYEVKGYFRPGDTQKYKAIRASNPHIELVFVFQRPSNPMIGSKVRKDGTRLTMSEWADKSHFKWYSVEELMADY